MPWRPGNAGAARSPSRPLRASPASTSTKSDAGPPGTGGPPLAKPAHAFLDVATAAQRGHHPAPQGLIELTVNEFRRLFDAGLLATHHTISTLLAWSVWRRRHQARARDGPLQTPRIRPAPMITITAVVLEARTYPSHTSTTTIGVLVLGAALLVGFVLAQHRVAAPLLPLRIVLDRVRGASYLAVGMSAVAVFAVFLFLTYYLQLVKGFSPIITGVSFLPLTAGIVTASTSANIVLLPRTGPRPLVAIGMTFGAIGMFLLARLTPESSYAAGVLPSLLILGLGFGLIFAPAISSATYGVAGQDAGVASAMVNTMQQVGGSVGTALLSTVAASSTLSFARTHTGAGVQVLAAVHGFTTAFIVSGSIFVVGAVLTGVLLPSGVLRQPDRPQHSAPPRRQ